MTQYQIIDEPRPKPQENLIVNPIVILLVGMLLPLFWTPPFYGRTWGPLLWVVINGYLLGSPSLKRELLIAVVGGAVWFALPYAVYFALAFVGSPDLWENAIPYIQIANQGVFFLTLYLIVFKQMVPYEIYQYLKERT